MPSLSYHFGLSPSDIWKMSFRELVAYSDALERLEKESR